jgi:DNA polymerase I-like protein with 3'-5' exonuclease and polymerase domains
MRSEIELATRFPAKIARLFNQKRGEKSVQNGTTPHAKMILQVHDELLFEAPHNEMDRLKKLVRESMENVQRLAAPLVADLKGGPNWRDMK